MLLDLRHINQCVVLDVIQNVLSVQVFQALDIGAKTTVDQLRRLFVSHQSIHELIGVELVQVLEVAKQFSFFASYSLWCGLLGHSVCAQVNVNASLSEMLRI